MLPVLGKKAVLEWCMCEKSFDWIIVWMSEMWKKYGIERKNGVLAVTLHYRNPIESSKRDSTAAGSIAFIFASLQRST
ncbi:hypothetical protein TNCV_2178791 [Trichonephila clavipes]|uniref:Uncharacterized protein n=1 Tax=Trichonephila clavipes TaxID=2585209 RepID=A0A8X6VUB5_TRICX|nr:hypothetical protein TNCV_2178791 [Trichonephila clavipes]